MSYRVARSASFPVIKREIHDFKTFASFAVIKTFYTYFFGVMDSNKAALILPEQQDGHRCPTMLPDPLAFMI